MLLFSCDGISVDAIMSLIECRQMRYHRHTYRDLGRDVICAPQIRLVVKPGI